MDGTGEDEPNPVRAFADALADELEDHRLGQPPNVKVDSRPLIHDRDALARIELGHDVARVLKQENRKP